MSDEIEPRRDPSSDQGAAIVEAILEACALLLDRDGYEALTTNAIARVAGVSIGSLYRYFPNTDAIVVGLARDLERRGNELLAAHATRVDLTDPQAVTRAFVSVMLDPRLGLLAARRALLLEVPPAWIAEATEVTDKRVEAQLVQVIHGLAPSLRAAPPDVMAFVAFHAVEGVVEEALLHDPSLLGEPSFHAELHRLAWAYVAADEGEPQGRDPVAPLAPLAGAQEVLGRFALEPSPPRPDGGAPRQLPTTKRGRRTVNAILDAMSGTLGELGWRGTSARRVAKVASVSPATLYQYFPDLRSIVSELARRREQRTLSRLEPILSAGDLDISSMISQVVRALIASALEEREVREVLLSQVPQRHLRAVSEPVNAAVRALVADRLASLGEPTPGGSPALRAFVISHAAERVIDGALLQRAELLADDALATEVETMIARYLRVPS